MAFVPLDWLADHVEVKPDTDAEQLAKDLVKVGLEEERIIPPSVTGPVVVGKVVRRTPEEHKNGKVINYCRVDVGQYNDEPGTGKEPSDIPSRSIICGAHNFVEGDYVVVSLPGAVLPGGFEIATRKTYGHISDGMICSGRELGISDEHDGIILLKDVVGEENIPPVGTDALPLLGLDGELLEINITPDRGYCFSMRGIAREYSHSTGAKFTDHGLAENLPAPLPEPNDAGFKVFIDDKAHIRGNIGCDRFVTRIVKNIDPKAITPKWMQERLTQAGMRPISLIVDISNYVMLDLGQPNHIYDYDKLDGAITVRRAVAGEQLVTLDDVQRSLDPEDLLICDGDSAQRILGLAGVMGGAETEVTDDTVNVLIEVAHFDPVTVARTARRHKLPTQSSKRYERCVDPMLADVAAQTIVNYLVEYGFGTPDEGVTDINNVALPTPIKMYYDEPEKLLGKNYTESEIDLVLESIGCTFIEKTQDYVVVQPASWRYDIHDSAHLIEEIARLNGYDQIPSTPILAPAGSGLSQEQKLKRKVANMLAFSSMTEVLSYPFVSNVWDKMFLEADDQRRNAIRLSNPLAEDAPYLRTSILDSLLDVAVRNVSRSNTDFAIYEMGLVYDGSGVEVTDLPSALSRPSQEVIDALHKATPEQPLHVAGVMVGNAVADTVLGQGRSYDWADAVDAVYKIAQTLSVSVKAVQDEYMPWHPGRCAKFVITGTDKVVAHAGQLHPKVAKAYGLPVNTAVFEVDLSALLESVNKNPIQIDPISTYPLAKEDIALVVDEDVSAGQILDVIYECGKGIIESAKLFDIYRGDQIDEGKKSLAFALRLRSDHTITSEESHGLRKKIIKKTAKLFGATLRS